MREANQARDKTMKIATAKTQGGEKFDVLYKDGMAYIKANGKEYHVYGKSGIGKNAIRINDAFVIEILNLPERTGKTNLLQTDIDVDRAVNEILINNQTENLQGKYSKKCEGCGRHFYTDNKFQNYCGC